MMLSFAFFAIFITQLIWNLIQNFNPDLDSPLYLNLIISLVTFYVAT